MQFGKTLILTTPEPDYLQDQLIYGFRKLIGERLIEFPKKEIMYKDSLIEKKSIYGRGFTLWMLLENIHINRDIKLDKIDEYGFKNIIFGSIQRQSYLLRDINLKRLKKGGINLYFIDGEDNTEVKLKYLPFGVYYKREIRSYSFLKKLNFIRLINFSIPKDKLQIDNRQKEKVFAKHVQCLEVYDIDEIKIHCSPNYSFDNEEDYYNDLSKSYYGITMKKAGWDCMRHYEIAACGAVICFYKLSEKYKFCAPHGLVDMFNCITFNSSSDLMNKISYIKDNRLYNSIRRNSINWIKNNTCEKVAGKILAKTI